MISIGNRYKLVPNLINNGRYILHYRTLQLYLSLGIKLSKVHGRLKLKQFDWLKKHLGFNTDKKTTVKCFEKDFFNFLNW